MATIVAGRFETGEQAEQTIADLVQRGFRRDDTSSFFVNPPGQHDQFPIGGDQNADANASKAHVGAAAGAAAGTAVGAVAALAVPGLGPALALGVVALGAYTGSLAGTFAKLGDKEGARESDASPGRPAGVLVAVHVDDPEAERVAMDILRTHGAKDIERRQGIWENGEWKDFDPVTPPKRVPGEQSAAPVRREDYKKPQ
jgi:hypothetical protein